MGRRSRSGSDSSDDESIASRSTSRSSRYSRASSGYSTETTSSKAALRDDHWSIKMMRYVTGAPEGPVAIKKVRVRRIWADEHDHMETTYYDSDRLYWAPIRFDASISEIDLSRQRQRSRQSSKSSRKSSSSPRPRKPAPHDHHREHFAPQPIYPGPPPMFDQPVFDQPVFDEPIYDHESMYDDGMGFEPEPFYPPPPMMMHHGAPPPPPPPPGGNTPAFFDITGAGQGGGFREGWDDE